MIPGYGWIGLARLRRRSWACGGDASPRAAGRGAPAPATGAAGGSSSSAPASPRDSGVDPRTAYPALIQAEARLRPACPTRSSTPGVSGETSAGALRRIDWLMRAAGVGARDRDRRQRRAARARSRLDAGQHPGDHRSGAPAIAAAADRAGGNGGAAELRPGVRAAVQRHLSRAGRGRTTCRSSRSCFRTWRGWTRSTRRT